MSAAELAVMATSLKTLIDAASTRLAEVKRELMASQGVGDRTVARLADGTRVGAVTYAEGSVKPVVTDEAALLAWVTKNHPDEITPRINDAYRARLLADTKRDGAAVDHATGALIPGITLTAGEGFIQVRPSTDPVSVAALVDAMRASHELALDGPRSPLTQEVDG